MDYAQLWQQYQGAGAFASGNQLGLPVNPANSFSSILSGTQAQGLSPSSYLTGGGGAAPQGGIGQWWNQNGSMITGGLSALSGLTSLYGQLKTIGLAEDAFDFEVDKFNTNYAAKRKDYENQLRDQWFARNEAMKARGRTDMPSEQSFLDQRNIAARSG